MQTRDLYIIGAGGFGREVAWLAERINEMTPTWNIKGFIDDDESVLGTQQGNYHVVGTCRALETMEKEVWVVCAIGASHVRRKVIEKISGNSKLRFATLVDPSVIMSCGVKIGEGSIICAGNILTVDLSIGNHVIINLDCTVGHDVVIEDYVTLYPSVNVSGCSVLETGVEMGTGSQIIQGKKVMKETIVGAGAVVTKDLPANCTAVGVPACPISFRD